jgi:glycosyltransferase involved in cell wall biosynthesis
MEATTTEAGSAWPIPEIVQMTIDSSARLDPEISIITPAYNGMPYLKECVESVLSQDFLNWEMLIGNNASRDGTADYLASLKDPRIRIFHHRENLGIFGNLNFLFAQARAPISQILCADDYLLPGALNTIGKSWLNVPGGVGLIRFNPTSAHDYPLQSKVCVHLVKPQNADLYFFLFGCICGNLSNISVRSKLVGELGDYRTDLPYAGDFEFAIRLARVYAISISPHVVSYVRRHAGVASNYLNRKGELAPQLFWVVGDLFERLRSKYPDFWLRLHATLNYEIRERDSGVRALLCTGDLTYLRAVARAANCSMFRLPRWATWLVYVLSAGGRLFVTLPARVLLRLNRRGAKRWPRRPLGR